MWVCVCVCVCESWHTRTHTLNHTHSHTHTQPHFCTHSHTHTHTLSLSLPLSLTHTRTQNLPQDFVQIVPAHLGAPIAASPIDFRRAFEFLEAEDTGKVGWETGGGRAGYAGNLEAPPLAGVQCTATLF